MTPEKTIYLIDGTAYIHRAYHAIRSLSNSEGMPTNAVFGFDPIFCQDHGEIGAGDQQIVGLAYR